MRKIKSWHGTETFYLYGDAEVLDGKVGIVDFDDGFRLDSRLNARISKLLGEVMRPADGRIYLEFVFDFKYEGYYDPGNVFGSNDTCYPPESEDNREITGVAVCVIDGQVKIDLPFEMVEKMAKNPDVIKALYAVET